MPDSVIFGTGPLGLAVARNLAAAGKRVRLVNRSGMAPPLQGVDVVAPEQPSWTMQVNLTLGLDEGAIGCYSAVESAGCDLLAHGLPGFARVLY
jgi:uncharacterized protein YbjT (DUF2867 family)